MEHRLALPFPRQTIVHKHHHLWLSHVHCRWCRFSNPGSLLPSFSTAMVYTKAAKLNCHLQSIQYRIESFGSLDNLQVASSSRSMCCRRILQLALLVQRVVPWQRFPGEAPVIDPSRWTNSALCQCMLSGKVWGTGHYRGRANQLQRELPTLGEDDDERSESLEAVSKGEGCKQR